MKKFGNIAKSVLSAVLALTFACAPMGEAPAGLTAAVSAASGTKQKGQSYFKTPQSGKADILLDNGKRQTVSVSDAVYLELGGSASDLITLSSVDKYKIVLSIGKDLKFEKGSTITLSTLDKAGSDTYLKLTWYLEDSVTSYPNVVKKRAELFEKVTIKALELDYSGKKTSSIYFYIRAHDKNGNKKSAEGIASFRFKGSKHKGTSGSNTSSSSSSGSKTSSSKNKVDTSAKGASYFNTPKTGYADTLCDGKRSNVSAAYYSGKERDSLCISLDKGDVYWEVGLDENFKQGDTLSLSRFSKKNTYISMGTWRLGVTAGAYSNNKDHAQYFEKATLKALKLDYTGKTDSEFYFYLLVHDRYGNKTASEGIARVKIENSKHIKPAATTTTTGNKTTTTTGNKTTTTTGNKTTTTNNKTTTTDKKTTTTGNKTTTTDNKTTADSVELFIDGESVKATVEQKYLGGPAFIINITESKKIEINVGSTSKTGDVLEGYVHFKPDIKIYGWIFGGYQNIDNGNAKTGSKDVFAKSTVKIINLDQAGKTPSKFYFYILLKDDEGKKMTFEGTVTITLYEKEPAKSGNADGLPHDGICDICASRGKCNRCGGSGTMYDPFTKKHRACDRCGGSGRCYACGGTGRRTYY